MTAITDLLTKIGNPGTVTSLQSPGKAIGASSINIGSATNWPTDTAVYYAMRRIDATLVSTSNPSGLVPGTYTEWKGTVSGTTISNLTLKYGTDQVYPAGTNTQVFIVVSSSRENAIVDWGITEHDQLGHHTNITATSINVSGASTFAANAIAPAALNTGIPMTKLASSYKFAAYRTGAFTLGPSGSTKIQCETEEFDTGSNYDNTTNYRFTVPVGVSGFAQFGGSVGVLAGVNFVINVQIWKNGVALKTMNQFTTNSNNAQVSGVSPLIQVSAGDYFELNAFNGLGSSVTGNPGASNTWFWGEIRSAT